MVIQYETLKNEIDSILYLKTMLGALLMWNIGYNYVLENLSWSVQFIFYVNYMLLAAFGRSCESTLRSAQVGVNAVTDRIHEFGFEVTKRNTEAD